MSNRTTAPDGSTLPAGAGPEGGEAESMEGGRRVNVLLVDDQPNNLLALEAVLAGEGLNLVRAHSGEQALLRILDDDYAAILMDVQMPGLDGFDTAELIRERDRSRHTPIIFLTAFQSNETQVARGYTLGAVDFLAKPIIPAVLRAKVAVFVELFLKSEQVRRQAERLVETQRQEHQRNLADERRRWEVERLREEAAGEKRAAEVLAQKARELTRSIAERMRAEELLRQRATQQEIVVALGQFALAGSEQAALLADAMASLARGLGAEFSRVMELAEAGDRQLMLAGYGWPEGADLEEEVGDGAMSLAVYTLQATEPIMIDDLRTESRFAVPGPLHDLGVVSGLNVFIRGRERPFGTLGAYTVRPRTFSRDDVHFLQAVANVLAAAIQRWRDEAELAAVRDQLEIQLTDMTRLHALSEQLSDSIELPAVLQKVLSAVTGLQGTDRGVLMLYDRARDTMTTAASVGFDPAELADEKPEEDRKGVSAVFSGGLVVEDVTADLVLTPHLRVAQRAGSLAVCSTPLLTCGNDLVGAIATYFPQRHRPSARETRLVELYARQAAEVIENAWLYREIQEADRRKGEFLAMLGHELRNPLAPILNALHVLRLPDLSPEEGDDARKVAERQVIHLARLVDDLLDVSRINSGKIELRKSHVDLREAAAGALESARPLIESRHHSLDVRLPDEPVPLLADATRLEQVLANLLNNAAKYTEPGGRITLEVEREAGEAIVRVGDDGIGIDAELLPRVFELFAQADPSLDRSQGGLGIGLTLVRRLVELHGGTVVARSPGRGLGSEFSVRLPLASPERSKEPTDVDRPAAADRPDQPRRVLIVDDNVDGARILARLLSAGGHRTDLAHNGAQALEVAHRTIPDVVLLDIGLPEMDGYEVARRLRGSEDLKGVLLVAVTGYGQEKDRASANEAGFDHHLVKPVDPESVRELIALLPSRS
jgi:signal transduction histidine kinase/DNA-binding response OmpR family regulator